MSREVVVTVQVDDEANDRRKALRGSRYEAQIER